MDLFDLQEVESKLSDVTVIPIPRSQTQNSRNYQREQHEQREQYDEQREQYKEREQKKQREQHKQRGHHKQRELHGQYEQHMQYKQREQYKQRKQNERRDQTGIQNTSTLRHRQMDRYNNAIVRAAGGQNYDLVAKAKDYYQKQLNSAVAATALQYTQQLQAQLALLQRQANNNLTITPTNPTKHNSINIGGGLNNDNDRTGVNYQYQIDFPQCSQGIVTTQKSPNITAAMTETSNLLTAAATGDDHDFVGKYSTLLALIEEMRRDIRPTYTGSRNSTERLKRSIAHARMLINECLGEIEGKPRQ